MHLFFHTIDYLFFQTTSRVLQGGRISKDNETAIEITSAEQDSKVKKPNLAKKSPPRQKKSIKKSSPVKGQVLKTDEIEARSGGHGGGVKRYFEQDKLCDLGIGKVGYRSKKRLTCLSNFIDLPKICMK